MAIKTFSQIIQSMIDDLRILRPALDTKPGTVARDLFINLPAEQIASIYSEISNISKTQSFLTAAGDILDQYGANFGVTRDQGRRASGKAVLTFTALPTNLSIPAGTTLTAKNGIIFRTIANISLSPAAKGVYAALARKLSSDLNTAGISDSYAVEVPVEATTIGSSGNVAPFSVARHSIPGISNATNISAMAGGSNPQTDSDYRKVIISALSGANIGTSKGYNSTLLSVPGISNVLVIEPGNPLLFRDGTTSRRATDGSMRVVAPGTGGKVDIWVRGSELTEATESYIFHDLSGTGNPAANINARILGQTTNTASLITSQKRALFNNTGELPKQPIDSIISVFGSISGGNFIDGVNYALVKDDNVESENTAFALDRLVFLQDYISLVDESVIKNGTNSIDSLASNNVRTIKKISQNISIANEDSIVSPLVRNKIYLKHLPVRSVSKVLNLTTGERYVVSNSGISEQTGINETGVVEVAGNLLPTKLDKILSDYTWSIEYDNNFDYFEPSQNNNLPNGIDWGRSNSIYMAPGELSRSAGRYNVTVLNNIERVTTAFYCDSFVHTVVNTIGDRSGASGTYVVLPVSVKVKNVVSVKSNSSGAELFATKQHGSFSANIIKLATDTVQADDGDEVTVYYNAVEIFNIDRNNGVANGNIIALSSDDVLEHNTVLSTLNDIYNGVSSKVIFVNHIMPNVPAVDTTNLSVLPLIVSNASPSGLVNKNAGSVDGLQPYVVYSDGTSRLAPTYLEFAINNALSSGGTFSINGTGWYKLNLNENILQGNTAGKIDLEKTIRAKLNFLSQDAYIARVTSFILDQADLAINGYELYENKLDKDFCIKNASLSKMTVDMTKLLDINMLNEFTIGTGYNIELYVVDPLAHETVSFVSGKAKAITQNKYLELQRVEIISGFKNNLDQINGTLKISTTCQPVNGSMYYVDYDYTAPVENERITVVYRYNNIIAKATTALEPVRPITADILIKLAKKMAIDISVDVVLSDNGLLNVSGVAEEIKSAVTSMLNAKPMGGTIYSSDIIKTVASVTGVSGADVTLFDYQGSDFNGNANRDFIKSDSNAYFEAGIIQVNIITR